MEVILIVCILINAYVVILFKIFERKKVKLLPAIVINYLVCVITGLLIFNPPPFNEVLGSPWIPFAIFLGFIFISVFNLVGRTVRDFGVMVATIFQKMSLIGPAIVGIVFYTESFGWIKGLGIIAALFSIVLISHPEKGYSWKDHNLWLPIGTLVGSAILEITLYYVNIEQLASNADPMFVTAIFFNAGIFGILSMIILRKKKDIIITKKEVLGGIALGIPNFFSIYTILYLLNAGWEGSSLFPIVNVGILFITGMAGKMFFKEKIDILKAWGFIAAILSISLIAIS